MLTLVLAAIKTKKRETKERIAYIALAALSLEFFLEKKWKRYALMEGEKTSICLFQLGKKIFLTNVPELSVPCFMAQFTLSLTLISSNSAAQIWYGGTFQRDNVGVLCQQPQSFVIPPGNCHKLRCQLHLVRACRVFPVS